MIIITTLNEITSFLEILIYSLFAFLLICQFIKLYQWVTRNKIKNGKNIEEQQGKDVFEYSIFGDSTGQSKIGDFA